MKGRATIMRAAAALAALGPVHDIPPPYQPREVAHQLRRVAEQPSKAKRAKVKAARKQRQKHG